MLGYQNCGKQSFSTTEDSAEGSGSGNGQGSTLNVGGGNDLGAGGGGYSCVPGKRLAIWLDPDDSGDIKAENYLGFVVSYSGKKSAEDNYNYYSASAHPLVGPSPIGFESHVFFYEGKDGLALNFFSNIDSGGSSNNRVDLDIEVSGNAQMDSVILSDDGHELKQVSSSGGLNSYEGRFHYWNNTDGGVIGPFQGENYKIHVRVLQTGDIQNARFYSANGYSFQLKDQQQDISSFIITFESIENCN